MRACRALRYERDLPKRRNKECDVRNHRTTIAGQ